MCPDVDLVILHRRHRRALWCSEAFGWENPSETNAEEKTNE